MVIVAIVSIGGELFNRASSDSGMMIADEYGHEYDEAVYPIDIAHDWAETSRKAEGKYGPMKYSTLSIKRELSKLGAWTATKQLLETAGYWDDYVLANYLSATDEVFVTACAALVANGIVTQAELDELLPLCAWTAG